MHVQDIKKIADSVYEAVRYFIPYCANYPKNENLARKAFWLSLMRASNDKYGTREKLRNGI